MKKTVIFVLSVFFAAFCLYGSAIYASDQELPKNTGNLRYSITVSKFENKAGWSGRWDIGDGFGEIMTNALNESGWFIVLGEKDMREEAMQEQDFAASGNGS